MALQPVTAESAGITPLDKSLMELITVNEPVTIIFK